MKLLKVLMLMLAAMFAASQEARSDDVLLNFKYCLSAEWDYDYCWQDRDTSFECEATGLSYGPLGRQCTPNNTSDGCQDHTQIVKWFDWWINPKKVEQFAEGYKSLPLDLMNCAVQLQCICDADGIIPLCKKGHNLTVAWMFGYDYSNEPCVGSYPTPPAPPTFPWPY